MWLDIGIVALFGRGIYCFIELVGWRTRMLARRTDRRAEDMYDQSPARRASSGGPPGSTAAPGRKGPAGGPGSPR